MRKMKRWRALLCAVLMAVTLLPVQAWATEDTPRTCQWTYVNPVYAGLYTDTVDSYAAYDFEDEDVHMSTSEEDAIAYVREQLIQRADTISVAYWGNIDLGSAWFLEAIQASNALIDKTGVHDKNDPHAGNYLSYQYCGFRGSCGFLANGQTYFTYSNIGYYTTAQQEAEVDKAVSNLLAELKLEGKSDYDKLAAIYDWMCENITYDYANKNNDSYTLKRSAYAALINRTAVCQGYAVLLYRLALECGIDAQIIAGDDHAWNIVKVGGLYYNLDTTWGAGHYFPRTYFLRGLSAFNVNHTAEDEFLQPEFTSAFPISQLDYGYFDINGDGSGSNIKDVACLYDYLTTGVKNSTFDSGFFSHAADINGDDAVDVYDLQLLYEKVCSRR